MGLSRLTGLTRALREQAGATMVEFAVVAIALFMVVTLIIQGGLVFGAWLAITNGAREGARYGAPCINRSVESCTDEAVEGLVRDRVAGWLDTSPERFAVDVKHDNSVITVTVHCTVTNFSPIPSLTDLHLSAESAMRTEVQK